MLGDPIRPNLYYLQPKPPQQLAPMALGPLNPRQREKHMHIHGGGAVRSAGRREDEILEENTRVLLVHGCDGVREDFGAAQVRPIVGDVAKEVNTCACVVEGDLLVSKEY